MCALECPLLYHMVILGVCVYSAVWDDDIKSCPHFSLCVGLYCWYLSCLLLRMHPLRSRLFPVYKSAGLHFSIRRPAPLAAYSPHSASFCLRVSEIKSGFILSCVFVVASLFDILLYARSINFLVCLVGLKDRTHMNYSNQKRKRLKTILYFWARLPWAF